MTSPELEARRAAAAAHSAGLTQYDAVAAAIVAACAGLDEDALGWVTGAVTADRDLEPADAVIWKGVAIVQRALLCDLYEVCQEPQLSALCAGFLRGRLERQDDARALQEGRALATTWTIRLTGYPLLYDYCTVAEIEAFACAQLDALEARLGRARRGELIEALVRGLAADRGPRLDRARLRG